FILSALTITLYAAGALQQSLIYLRRIPPKHFISIVIGVSATALHLLVTLKHTLLADAQYNLGLYNSASIVSLAVVTFILILTHKKPMSSLLLGAYPFAALSVLLLTLYDAPTNTTLRTDNGILLHIVLSIIAYSIFLIAAFQSILILAQDHNLKRKTHTVLTRNLPPLLTMEKLLFEMIWSGTILLGIAMVIGAVFIEDIFAQHLAHKTVLSIASLLVFSTLLFGRHRYGWRGVTASKLTLSGFALLMLGFFGSKFVLETLLSNSTH
ncbi:MAG: cytochrome C assembly protein, partial [Phototrophicales bacterium]